MEVKFVLHPVADKQLHKLPAEADERIRKKLTDVVTDEFRDLEDYGVEKVRGTSYNVFRIRIGGYRVFFFLEPTDEETIAAILHVDKREGAYGNIERLVNRLKGYLSQ